MLQLVPMTTADFAAYAQESIRDYAQENVRSGRWSAEEAETEAAKQYAELLPKGVDTPDNYLYHLHVPGEGTVGVLWFAITKRGKRRLAFVYDIAITEQFRRRGYATQAFQAMEHKVRELGVPAIGLHVFGHNHGARALYEQLGFVTTNINMIKEL